MGFCLKKRLLIDKNPIKPFKNPLWVHCASVGEFNTFKPILKELKSRFEIVLTYFSPRAQDFLLKQKGLYDYVSPLPLDIPFLVRKFEKLVNPKAIIVVEREFWPFFIKSTRAKKILVNAYAKGSLIEKMLVKEFSLILARSPEDKELFVRQRASKVEVCENMKLIQEIEWEKPELGLPPDYKLLVAGSTHEGEEEVILKAFIELRKEVPLRVVIAPRHISRAKEVLTLVQSEGLKAKLKSEYGGEESWDVIILDTLGELKNFYSIADLTIVGGTYVPVGGHNLLEPAYMGKPVIFGEYTHKVKDLEKLLLESSLGYKAADSEQIVKCSRDILAKGPEAKFNLKEKSLEVKKCYMEHILSELE